MGQDSIEPQGNALFIALLASKNLPVTYSARTLYVSSQWKCQWWSQRWSLTDVEPGSELWQLSCSPQPQESFVFEYCEHGLFKIHFFHHSLEEEGFSHSLPPTTKFSPSEELIQKRSFPCDKTRFPSFLCKIFMKSPCKFPSGDGALAGS